MMAMQLRFDCPEPECPALIEFEPLAVCDGNIECPRCHAQHSVTVDDAVRADGPLERCPRCGGQELFTRKDFPQALGLAIVAVAGIVSCVYLESLGFYAIGVLAAAALFDAILYALIRKVTVCYRCRAEYRKLTVNPAHQAFDLATSEKYA